LRRAGKAVLADPELIESPGFEERLHQREHALVLDPCPYPLQSSGV